MAEVTWVNNVVGVGVAVGVCGGDGWGGGVSGVGGEHILQ